MDVHGCRQDAEEDNSSIAFDLAVNATSVYLKFPLLIGKADELFVSQLSQSQDRSGFLVGSSM